MHDWYLPTHMMRAYFLRVSKPWRADLVHGSYLLHRRLRVLLQVLKDNMKRRSVLEGALITIRMLTANLPDDVHVMLPEYLGIAAKVMACSELSLVGLFSTLSAAADPAEACDVVPCRASKDCLRLRWLVQNHP